MKIKIKIIACVLSIILIIPSMAYASTITLDKPTATLKEFLQAAYDQDILKMVNLEEDERLLSCNLSAWHKKNFDKTGEKLISYSILKSERILANKYKFITELKMNDGSISQVPFLVGFRDGKWKILITDTSLENKDFRIIKERKSETNVLDKKIKPFNSDMKAKASSTRSYQLASWNFSELFSFIYSIQEFDVNSPTHTVVLNLRQWSEVYSPSVIADLNYSVVYKRWYGDVVWGQTNVFLNNRYSAKQFVISGRTEFLEGAQVRIMKNYYVDHEETAAGFGEIYNGN